MKQEHRGREAQESPGFSRGEDVKDWKKPIRPLLARVARWLVGA